MKACGCGKLRNALLLLSVLAVSCASEGLKPIDLLSPDFDRLIPRSVVVLPMDNMSPDLDATPLIRPILQQRLIYHGYNCIPLDKIDPILKEKGVMISHDVYMFTPQELGKMLKADAVVYATVTEFNKHYAFFYADIIVGLKLEMVDTRTGESLWKSEHHSTENTLLASLLIASQYKKSKDALAAAAVYNAAFALLSSYRPFAENAVRAAIASLPFGPAGARQYPWDVGPQTYNTDLVAQFLNKMTEIDAYSPYLPEEKKSKPKAKPFPPPNPPAIPGLPKKTIPLPDIRDDKLVPVKPRPPQYDNILVPADPRPGSSSHVPDSKPDQGGDKKDKSDSERGPFIFGSDRKHEERAEKSKTENNKDKDSDKKRDIDDDKDDDKNDRKHGR